MTEHVTAVEPTATLRKAANVMRGHAIGCFVVTDKDRMYEGAP